MNQKDFASKLYYGSCIFIIFFIAAAASFNGYYDKWHFREEGVTAGNTNGFLPLAAFPAMVDGTAKRPIIYRQLLPMLANSIDRLVPESTKDWLFAVKSKTGVPFRDRFFNSPLPQNRIYFLRYWVVYILVFLFAWISVWAMYRVCKSVGYPSVSAALAAIVMVLLIPYFQSIGGYIYDYPELAFFALTVWMALKFDWWWMIPVVALGALNKESFLFFIPTLYPLLRQRTSRVNALVGTGVLGLICAAIYCVLRVHFQLNPGANVENHVIEQIYFTLHPINLLLPFAPILYLILCRRGSRIKALAGTGILALTSVAALLFAWGSRYALPKTILFRLDNPNLFITEKTYGINMIQIYNPLFLALVAWTLWRGWRSLPQPIQRHAQIAAIINFPLYFVLGYPGEVRGLSMLYVTLLLLLAANLAQCTSDQSRTSAQPQISA